MCWRKGRDGVAGNASAGAEKHEGDGRRQTDDRFKAALMASSAMASPFAGRSAGRRRCSSGVTRGRDAREQRGGDEQQADRSTRETVSTSMVSFTGGNRAQHGFGPKAASFRGSSECERACKVSVGTR